MKIDRRIEDLQAVSGHVMTKARRIEALENKKRHVDPGSEEFRSISEEIERVADEVREVSHAETGLAVNLSGQKGLPTVAEADERSRKLLG